jgi:hypothetical protein
MRVAIFFLCLCSLLLKGNADMFAGLQQNGNGYVHTQHQGGNRHSNFAHASHGYSSLADTNLESGPEYVIDDNEDEDNNNIPAEKYRLLAGSHATHAYPSYPSILNYHCNCYKATPSACIPTSDKYILQGVLRI